MPARIIDGKKIAEEIKQELKLRVNRLKDKGVTPRLDVILVGEDPASKIYTGKKIEEADKLGVSGELHKFPENVGEEELIGFIEKLNQDEKIHGILVQLPLPEHISEQKVLDMISPEKDVDGLTTHNLGNLFTGEPTFEPCTPKGIMKMLEHEGIEIQGRDCVIIGRSNIVGKPMTFMLMGKNGTVTICHSKTKNLEEKARQADILVVAIGKPKFVTRDMVKPGSVVIDVGTNRLGGKLCGDVDFDQVKEIAGYITPVPGGVGPLTVTMVLENTIISAERFSGKV